jgi:uncharacterized protein GlcG (DUF336 family)
MFASDKAWQFRMRRLPALALALAPLLSACAAGNPVQSPVGSDPGANCTGGCADPGVRLSVADVERVLAQGVNEALARKEEATIAVVDRVGNVLAVYRMGDKLFRRVVIASKLDGAGEAVSQSGLEGIRLPALAGRLNLDDQAAIAKAITGAYLSSEGNGFSSRTASQIIQENFNPGELRQPGGPLFGVQFSQLACSDVMRASDGTRTVVGPQRSPLGLSADPGGFPLYKNGTPVGGVGVIADDVYGLDRDIYDRNVDVDEAIALAATFGFAAPTDRRADRITADGKTLRFSDLEFADLASRPAQAPAFADLPPSAGSLIKVKGYFDGATLAGTAFGQPESGIRPDRENTFPGQDAFVLVDQNDMPRFAPRDGTDGAFLGGATLKRDEVTTVLRAALAVANRSRAQIRRPLGTQARVSIAVTDTQGAILGFVRTRDAPVFGIDVAVQKARSAALFSSNTAALFLQSLPDAKYLSTIREQDEIVENRTVSIGSYITGIRSFAADANVLADDRVAWSARALGNLSRPFFPDGINGAPPGPFSKPPGEWSVFSTGLQLDVSINAILQHVLFIAGAFDMDVTPGCTGVELRVDPLRITAGNKGIRLGNGLQIFPGGVPIFRGGQMVGAIGISGDGVDQDDMTAFLGVNNAGSALGGAISNAPAARRSDTVTPRDVRLRYAQCPQAPFIDSDEGNPCAGK